MNNTPNMTPARAAWKALSISQRESFLVKNGFQIGFSAHCWNQLGRGIQGRFEVSI